MIFSSLPPQYFFEKLKVRCGRWRLLIPRILFFAKILNDNTSIKASKKTNAIYIQELIYRYLTKEISNHTQIEKFFEKKNKISNFLLKKKF